MDLPGPIHDFLLVFLGLGLILGGIGVVLLNSSSRRDLLLNSHIMNNTSQ